MINMGQIKNGIVLNRMYVGDYLSSNLGHEVINLYQADNGRNYLYLNATGDFVKTHANQIKWMLMVKYYGIGEVEVIGLATGLKDVYSADQKFTDKYGEINHTILKPQEEFIKNEPEGVCYGGVPIFDIFGETGQQSIFITYIAEKVFIPRDGVRLFVRFHSEKTIEYPAHDKNDVVVCLKGYQQAKASLKQYIYPEGTYIGDLAKQNIQAKQEDYNLIREMLIDDTSLWTESNNQVDDEELRDINKHKISLFDICQIQNDENKFSNALAYFMLRTEYSTLWTDFFKLYDINLAGNYYITREESSKIDNSKYKGISGGRIDLLIRTSHDIVVIENKIKSDINSIEEDGEGKQLRRYFNYINWLIKDRESNDYRKKAHFVILTPKYNIPKIDDVEMREKYIIITYADLYDYLTEHQMVFVNDNNFMAFYEAMHRHTHENVNDYLYFEMQEKFFRRIRNLRTS